MVFYVRKLCLIKKLKSYVVLRESADNFYICSIVLWIVIELYFPLLYLYV